MKKNVLLLLIFIFGLLNITTGHCAVIENSYSTIIDDWTCNSPTEYEMQAILHDLNSRYLYVAFYYDELKDDYGPPSETSLISPDNQIIYTNNLNLLKTPVAQLLKFSQQQSGVCSQCYRDPIPEGTYYTTVLESQFDMLINNIESLKNQVNNDYVTNYREYSKATGYRSDVCSIYEMLEDPGKEIHEQYQTLISSPENSWLGVLLWIGPWLNSGNEVIHYYDTHSPVEIYSKFKRSYQHYKTGDVIKISVLALNLYTNPIILSSYDYLNYPSENYKLELYLRKEKGAFDIGELYGPVSEKEMKISPFISKFDIYYWAIPHDIDPGKYRAQIKVYQKRGAQWVDLGFTNFPESNNIFYIDSSYDFVISSNSVKDSYSSNEESEIVLTIKNNLNSNVHGYLDVNIKNSNGDEYQIGFVAFDFDSLTSETITKKWLIPQNALSGQYEISVDIWKDGNRKMKYSDNLNWNPIFTVSQIPQVPIVSANVTSFNLESGFKSPGDIFHADAVIINNGNQDHSFDIEYSIRDSSGAYWTIWTDRLFISAGNSYPLQWDTTVPVGIIVGPISGRIVISEPGSPSNYYDMEWDYDAFTVTNSNTEMCISVSADKPKYQQGDLATITIQVQNNFASDTEVWLGITLKDKIGTEYDIPLSSASTILIAGNTHSSTYYWNIPLAAMDGQYDIAVNCWKDQAQTSKYTDNLEWGKIFTVGVSDSGQISNVDVALVIDSSGSMSSNDRQNLRKDAAKLFIDLSEDADQIAIVDFDGGARVWQSLILVAGHKDTLKNAVNKVDSSGSTNIGGGLQIGYNELNGLAADINHQKAAVLLTDGQHNTGTHPNSVVPQYAQKGWPVYTIALSSNADKQLLKQISTDTGGSFYDSPSSNALQDIYNRISQNIRGLSQLGTNTGFISQDQTLSGQVPIDPTVQNMNYVLTWGGSDLDLLLFYPDGSPVPLNISSPSGTDDPGIVHIISGTYEIYKIQNPQSGTWNYEIIGVDVVNQEEYALTISAATNIKLDAYTDSLDYSPGACAQVTAEFTDDGYGIAGAQIYAEVTLPDHTNEILQLSDQGNGLYHGIFCNTSIQGLYYILVEASDGDVVRQKLIEFNSGFGSVSLPPVANFSADITNGVSPFEVQFTDNSMNAPEFWEWDFGDGSPVLAEKNPVHRYSSPGYYTVTLKTTNGGGTDTLTRPHYITAGPFGTLKVVSSPVGAEVMIEGMPMGNTWCTLQNIPATTCNVTLTKFGYEDYTKVVDVTTGKMAYLVANLKPVLGTLKVMAVPENGEVFLDGTSSGITPIVLTNITAGSHNIRVEQQGYEPWEQDVEVNAGMINVVFAALSNHDSGIKQGVVFRADNVTKEGTNKNTEFDSQENSTFCNSVDNGTGITSNPTSGNFSYPQEQLVSFEKANSTIGGL